MSVYLKPFTTSDVIISPFEVNKSFVCHDETPELKLEILATGPQSIIDDYGFNNQSSYVTNPTNFSQIPQQAGVFIPDVSNLAININYNESEKVFSLPSNISQATVDINLSIFAAGITNNPQTMIGYIGKNTTLINDAISVITSSASSSDPRFTFLFPSVTLESGNEYLFGLQTSTGSDGGRIMEYTASFQQTPGTIQDFKVDRYIGQNITSSIFVPNSNLTGVTDLKNKKLIYESIKQLYYSNYIKSDNGSPVSTASFNNDGTVTGPRYTPNYYNYLTTTLLADRFFPTGSNQIIGVVSIPSNLFGEHVKLNSVTLSTPNYTLFDDGNGNMLSGSQKVGDIIYEHGIIVLTNDGIEPIGGDDGYGFITYGTGLYGVTDQTFINDFMANSNFTCSFESTTTIYESQYKCTLRQNEFNFTQNPTIISGSSLDSTLYDFATGSYFTPYVTTVGMYNNAKELIAVAKLAQPLPISQVTDTSILVNLDL